MLFRAPIHPDLCNVLKPIIMYKESRLYSILNNKCPHCHKGNFFESQNPYALRSFAKMNSHCANCQENFKREPGYYFGATYVSYALTVGFGIGLFLLLCVVLGMSVYLYFIFFAIALIALLPLFFRVSRLIWINLFVGYKREKLPVEH